MMKSTDIKSWKDQDWSNLEHEVFRMQRRIFRQSLNGNTTVMQKNQLRLIASKAAKYLAVRQATEDSQGKNTSGVDGIKSLTERQKLTMAKSLRVQQEIRPVRRVYIPKPGKAAKRQLGIPTIANRALQNLIRMALEPEWEARFSYHQYGFRKGRSAHDAIANIRGYILHKPCWVLDADIEQFFDRIDHEFLLKKLSTHSRMEKTIRKILRAGAEIDGRLQPTREGTPQGGPMSPLLANIVLTGLEDDLLQEFRRGSLWNGSKLRHEPRIVIYADDLVVLHPEREVIEEIRNFIDDWLRPAGLNLNEDKTRIRHTLLKEAGDRGFDFLGFNIRQHEVGPHQGSKSLQGLFTLVEPSRAAQKEITNQVAKILRTTRWNKRRKPIYQQKGYNPTATLIHRLNPILRGWGNYHRFANAKSTFSRIDHLIFLKLWKWAKRNRPKATCGQRIREFWAGGKPWLFSTTNKKGEPVVLLKLSEVGIKRHTLVKANKSFYDGDWAYWTKRLGSYPGIPKNVASCLQRQKGRCLHCHQPFDRNERWYFRLDAKRKGTALHTHCVSAEAEKGPREEIPPQDTARSPVH